MINLILKIISITKILIRNVVRHLSCKMPKPRAVRAFSAFWHLRELLQIVIAAPRQPTFTHSRVCLCAAAGYIIYTYYIACRAPFWGHIIQTNCPKIGNAPLHSLLSVEKMMKKRYQSEKNVEITRTLIYYNSVFANGYI